jgi:hypothetical protein
MANQDTILSPYFIYPFLENFYGLVMGGTSKKWGVFLGLEGGTYLGGKKEKKKMENGFSSLGIDLTIRERVHQNWNRSQKRIEVKNFGGHIHDEIMLLSSYKLKDLVTFLEDTIV